jgi:uncharacterized membrane protein
VVLAALRSGLYNVFLLLHIVAFVVAFAPAVINPIAIARIRQASGDGALPAAARWMAANGRQVHFPALVTIAPLGIVMVLLSDDAFGFDQAWVWLGLLVWLGICGVITALVIPGERRLAEGDLAAEKQVAMGGQIATLLAVAILYLMIWKPGL